MITLRKFRSVRSKSDLSDHEFLQLLTWAGEVYRLGLRQAGSENKPIGFHEFLKIDFTKALHSVGIHNGTVLEVGGSRNSFSRELTDYDFKFMSIYPDLDDNRVLVANAAHCPHLESEQFDAIFSKSVFEHIDKPWQAGKELTRLLKPGGIMYHCVPFSYFYHGAPADFWRYTPDAMEVLFSSLRTIKSVFYGNNRRRDNRGGPHCAVDRDGGQQFAVDALGGWRENWHTIYIGHKDLDFTATKSSLVRSQIYVDLMKYATCFGLPEQISAQAVSDVFFGHCITLDGIITAIPKDASARHDIPAPDDILALWQKRGRHGVPKPSPMRFSTAAAIDFDSFLSRYSQQRS